MDNNDLFEIQPDKTFLDLYRKEDVYEDVRRIIEQIKTRHRSSPDETDMLIKARLSDVSTMNEFIKTKLWLVARTALRYVNQGLPFMDLFQEGFLGLVDAIENYDTQSTTSFHRYALGRINQSIRDALIQYARIIYLPRYLIDEARLIDSASELLFEKLGRKPTISEIAQHLDYSPALIEEVLIWTEIPASIEMLLETNEEDLPTDDYQTDQLTFVIKSAIFEKLYENLSELKEKHRRVIELRFGLYDDHDHTQLETGQILGVSSKRVCQIEEKSLERLRHPSMWRGFRDWFPH